MIDVKCVSYLERSVEHTNKFIRWGRVCVQIRFHLNFHFVSSILNDEIEAKKKRTNEKIDEHSSDIIFDAHFNINNKLLKQNE